LIFREEGNEIKVQKMEPQIPGRGVPPTRAPCHLHERRGTPRPARRATHARGVPPTRAPCHLHERRGTPCPARCATHARAARATQSKTLVFKTSKAYVLLHVLPLWLTFAISWLSKA